MSHYHSSMSENAADAVSHRNIHPQTVIVSKSDQLLSTVWTEDQKVGSERMSRMRWVNWRVSLVIAAIAMSAIVVFRGTGVPEVHNAHQPFNFALVDPRPSADDWPAWRGKDGRNVAHSEHFPVEWASSDHEGWQIPIPGYGNSTPIIWGQRLFLPTYEMSPRRVSLQSVNRKTGRLQWQTVLHQGGFPLSRLKSSVASSTPACDGQNVFMVANVHDKLWITAVDLTGKIVWQREAGPYESAETFSSSPVFYKSLVIVAADRDSDSYLAALHRQTGEIIWRVKRPNGASSGSPVLATIAGIPQLILGGVGTVISYDPATGKILWNCQTTTGRVSNSIAFDDERIFSTGVYPNPEVICIKGNGTGDVTKTHLEWRLPQIGSEFTSPVHFNGLVYVLADDGRLTCIQAASGKVEWNKQFKGSFSASPIVVGDYLFCANESGTTYFVTLGSSLPHVVENSLGGGMVASPVFVGDSIFIRTTERLHRIAIPASEPFVENPTDSKRRL